MMQKVLNKQLSEMPLVRGGYEYCSSRGRGVRRGMKRDRVTRDLPTPTQSPRFMSPVANSSKVVDANEEVPKIVVVFCNLGTLADLCSIRFEVDMSTVVAEVEVFVEG
nr:hypothetical protein [Tanacetum cinerariifolium]